ncbi:MAG: hypothetical protein ACOCTI_00425 [Phycisphaeraceae bacterium]
MVGAGEMARLVCQHLRKAEARQFTVTSRTLANARTLAEACDGEAVPYRELDGQLAKAAVVIAATACPRRSSRASVSGRCRRSAISGRCSTPIFAVPRNVEPAVQDLGQVFLYDIDTLGGLSSRTSTSAGRSCPAARGFSTRRSSRLPAGCRRGGRSR